MCQIMRVRFSCGHNTTLGEPITCDEAETTGNQCEEPVDTPIDDVYPCKDCSQQESVDKESEILEASRCEHEQFLRRRGLAGNDEDEEDLLQRAIQESMEDMNLSEDFDGDEIQKAITMSRNEFPWSEYITEEQWNRSSQQPTDYGYRGESSSTAARKTAGSSMAQEVVSRVWLPPSPTAASIDRSPTPPPPYDDNHTSPAKPSQPQTAAEIEEIVETIEEEAEEDDEDQHCESDAGPLPTIEEKPFMNRLKTYHDCKHLIIERTQIQREGNDSPATFPAIAQGVCPECQRGEQNESRKGKGRAPREI